MSRARRIACLAILMLAPVAAAARGPATGDSAVYQKCLDSSGGVDPVMKLCGKDEIARQDKILNADYAKLRAKLTPALQGDLLTAERAFLAYREAQCRFAYDRKSPGTMAGLLYQSCVLELTAARIKQLREALTSE